MFKNIFMDKNIFMVFPFLKIISPVYTIFCLQQEATARECGHARLHGPRGAVQEHGVRLQRGLVQLRLHALQTAEGAQSLQTAQNKGGRGI